MEEASGGIKSKWLEVFDSGDISERNFYNVVVVTSFLLFNLNAVLILSKLAPNSARQTPEQLWKWRNVTNSLVHSVLSGVGALFNLLKSPQLRDDLITRYTFFSLTTLSFSLGYFIYDFIDMATHHRRRSTYELLIHHILVIVGFGLAVVTQFYQGFALIALIIEINSIFLHIRQLLIIQGWDKTNFFYKVNSYINLGTFVVFRLMNLVWMIWWLARYPAEYNVGKLVVSYTAFAMLFVLVHSLKLLKKILIADGYVSPKNLGGKPKANVEPKPSETSLSGT